MNAPESAARADTRSRLRAGVFASVLFVASVALYHPSTQFGFSLDDPLLTTQNSHVSGFDGDYSRFFSTSLYAGASEDAGNANLYRPVSKSSIALNYVLAGRSFDPGAFHWFNVLLYAACVVVVFCFVRRAAPPRAARGDGYAFLVALLFCVLPSHLESVCNIKHREEVLACLFGLAAWAVALRARNGRGRIALAHAAVPFLFLLALGSKESAILLYPCMILWELRSSESLAAFARRPPAYLLLVPAAIGVYFALRWNALGSFLNPPGTRTFFGEEVGILARAAISSATFFRYYLWDQLISLRLDPAFSSRFLLLSGGRPALLDAIAFAGLCGVWLAGIWGVLARRSIFAFWVTFVLVTSFLSLNVVPIGTAGAFRLMFTPSVGLCVLVALALRRFAAALARFFRWPPPVPAAAFPAAMIVLVAFYASVTHARMGIWKDGGRIYAYSAALEPKEPMRHYSAGQYFARTGSESEKYAFYEASLAAFLAFRDQPQLFDERSVDAFSVVATEVAHQQLARDPERAIALADLAIEQFERLVEMRAGRVDSNATAPYYVKAAALLRLGRREASLAACRAGLAIAHHRGLAQLRHALESAER